MGILDVGSLCRSSRCDALGGPNFGYLILEIFGILDCYVAVLYVRPSIGPNFGFLISDRDFGSLCSIAYVRPPAIQILDFGFQILGKFGGVFFM